MISNQSEASSAPQKHVGTLVLDQRRSLFALNAFNVAILTSIQKVSQPVFAQARIQFLKDGLNAIYKNENVPEHPVLDEIKLVVQQNDLPKSWFMRLIK